jgi:DNA-binding transcriptional LysR family regulator
VNELRWDDLRTFLAIARGGSLNAAADSLGVNHSTIWRRLAALEEALSAVVFDRPSYELTPLGEVLLARAERVEDEVHGLLREVAGHHTAPVGTVRVATTGDLVDLLVPHLGLFTQRHPGIEVELLLGARLVDLERREADVALRPTRHPPESAVGRRICELAWGAYGRRVGPWVGFTSDLDHLASVRWWRDRWPDADVVLRVSSVEAMSRAVQGGIGSGLLPVHVGDRMPDVGRLAPIDPVASSALWLLVHADLRRTARVRLLVDFLSQALSQQIDLFEGRLAPT